MKKLNPKGFSAMELSLIVVLVGLIAGVGYYVFSKNKKNGTLQQTTTQSTQPQTTPNPEPSKPKIDTSIKDVDISLVKESDISKLPNYAPASFKSFMTKLLKENKPDPVSGCVFEYGLSRISQVNIAGGYSPISNDNGCGAGGAPILWAVTPNDTWESAGGNGVDCETESGGLVYEEFATHCSDNKGAFIVNPNGSIKSLAE